MNEKIRLFVALVITISIFGCSSGPPHTLNDETLSKEWAGKVYDDVLVIGVYPDRTFRVSAETAFSESLKNVGVSAKPSYDLIPDLGGLETNDAIASEIANSGSDGVLVIATLDEGYEYDAGDYFATRGMVSLLGGDPGAGTDLGSMIAWAGSGEYTLYVGLWDAQSRKPVWQATTDSETTGSESEDNKTLAEFVAQTLRSKNLIQ